MIIFNKYSYNIIIFFIINITIIWSLQSKNYFQLKKSLISYKMNEISIIDIPNQNSFDDTIAIKDIPIVIDFQKSNCRPCKLVAPKFFNLAKKYSEKVRFYKVDADSSSEAKNVLKSNLIKAVPTFHLWFQGEKIESFEGAAIDDLDYAISDLLEKIHK